MNKRLKFFATLAFIGILAGGVHLSYEDYKGTSLSRLPTPAVKPAARVAISIPFISSASAATIPEGASAGRD